MNNERSSVYRGSVERVKCDVVFPHILFLVMSNYSYTVEFETGGSVVIEECEYSPLAKRRMMTNGGRMINEKDG